MFYISIYVYVFSPHFVKKQSRKQVWGKLHFNPKENEQDCVAYMCRTTQEPSSMKLDRARPQRGSPDPYMGWPTYLPWPTSFMLHRWSGLQLVRCKFLSAWRFYNQTCTYAIKTTLDWNFEKWHAYNILKIETCIKLILNTYTYACGNILS